MERKRAHFGFIVGTAFVLVSAALFWNAFPAWPALLAGGVLLVFLAAVSPADLALAERLWMKLAYALGWIVSRLILGMFYYLIVTPVALVGRAFGTRFLGTPSRRGAGTYWRPREDIAHDYERQF